MSPKPSHAAQRGALPPGLLIRTGRWVWTTMWQVMMAKLAPPSPDGDYVRPPSEFRGTIAPETITQDGAGDRYRLIVGWGCPWAHRTLVARALLGLEGAIALWWVIPDRDTGRWVFAPHDQAAPTPQMASATQPADLLTDQTTDQPAVQPADQPADQHADQTTDQPAVQPADQPADQHTDRDRLPAGTPLMTLYQQAEAGYGGRATVPVLWDTHTHRVINNESADIIEILNHAFAAWPGDRSAHLGASPSPTHSATDKSASELDLNPPELREAIATWNDRIYATVNNGVYRCGFAQSQAAYDRACGALFDTLDAIETTLSDGRMYLCGDRPTLVDVRLFPTLIRFDLVYYSLFNCNRRRIADYPHLSRYLRHFYQQPGIAQTCNLEAVIEDYYGALFPLNPGGIVPAIADPQAFRTWLTQTP